MKASEARHLLGGEFPDDLTMIYGDSPLVCLCHVAGGVGVGDTFSMASMSSLFEENHTERRGHI